MKKRKIVSCMVSLFITSNLILLTINVYATTLNESETTNEKVESFISDELETTDVKEPTNKIDNSNNILISSNKNIIESNSTITISTNSNLDIPFKINERFILKINIKNISEKRIKTGDKIVVQLPKEALRKLDTDDVPSSLLNSFKSKFNQENGIFTIEFTKDIEFDGEALIAFNFTVLETKIEKHNITAKYITSTSENDINVTNNIFSSEGNQKYTYSLISPYWNTDKSNWLGISNNKIGKFFISSNTAGFYFDINFGLNYENPNPNTVVTMDLQNQILNKESLRLYKYNGSDKNGIDITDKLLCEKVDDMYKLVINDTYTSYERYRLYYDVAVINKDAEILSQYYITDITGNNDSHTPILKSEMVNKISDSNFSPKIYSPAITTIKKNGEFDPMKGVTSHDLEDGNITKDIEIIKNTVKVNLPGSYEVIYRVKDSAGNIVEYTRIVNVVIDNPPIIKGTDNVSITEGTKFDSMLGVSATDIEDGIITNDIKIIGSVNINKPGIYELTYIVTDSNENTTSNVRIVTVNPKMEVLNHIPTINAVDKVLSVGDTFNPLDGVTAHDKEDGDITLTEANIIANNVDMSQAGTYSVTYKVTDSKGASTVKTITVVVNPKMEVLNHIPTINAVDKVLSVGDTFNPLDGVTAHDKEDGDITLTEANIIANNVDMSQAGTYTVTYKVTDSKGASTVKTITVVVNPKMEVLNHIPTINAVDKVLSVGDTFNPLDGVTAHDKEDGDITLTEANIIANNVDMSQAGTYSVTYKVTDSKGASTVKTITVTVNEKATIPVEKPDYTTTSKPDKLPLTGDVSNLGLLGLMFAGSGGMLLGLNRKNRKK